MNGTNYTNHISSSSTTAAKSTHTLVQTYDFVIYGTSAVKYMLLAETEQCNILWLPLRIGSTQLDISAPPLAEAADHTYIFVHLFIAFIQLRHCDLASAAVLTLPLTLAV